MDKDQEKGIENASPFLRDRDRRSPGYYIGITINSAYGRIAAAIAFAGGVASVWTVFHIITDNLIISSIIVTITLMFLGALVLAILYRKSLIQASIDLNDEINEINDQKVEIHRLKRQIHSGAIDSHEKLYGVISTFHGVVKDEYIQELEIRDNGSAEAQIYQTIFSLNQPIQYLEYSYSIPSAVTDLGKLVTLPPTLKFAGHTVDINISRTEQQSRSWEFVFNPPIEKGERASFVLTRQSPAGTFLMNLDDLKNSGQEYEYSSQRISYPTKKFAIKILFPPNYNPTRCEAVAWYGRARVKHNDETRRIEPGFKHNMTGGICILQLEIPYPLHGLTYAIIWRPPENHDRPNV